MHIRGFAGMNGWMVPMFETPGDGGSGGGSTAPAGTGAATSGAAGAGASGSTGASGGTTPGAAGPAARFEDDPRYKGVLNDLQKERRARQERDGRLTSLQAQLDEASRRVAALAGVNQPSAQEVADEQVRERFRQLYPQLGSLSDEKIERLLALADNADSLEAATTNHWTSLATRMLDGVKTEMSKAMGGELTPRQIQKLERAYYSEAQSNPEFLRRHENGDQSLISEFVKEYMEDFVEPGRRKALAAEEARMRRVPNSRDRSVVGQGGKKLDLSKDADFGDAVLESFKRHGGEFTGR